MSEMLKIGTRGSKLALAQTNLFINALVKAAPKYSYSVVPIKTTGDIITYKPLVEVGGKGLFLKEIEEQLLANQIDVAVHSLKDVPALLPAGLALGCVLRRGDPRDVFLSKKYSTMTEMPHTATIATGSLRRQMAIRRINQNGVKIVDIRGNIDTRISKMLSEEVDAIVIAMAGLERLQTRVDCFMSVLEINESIPAIGQGFICVECRSDDSEVMSLLKIINNRRSYICAAAERQFLADVGADCHQVIGAIASIDQKNMIMHAMLSGLFLKAQISIDGQGYEESVAMARALGSSIAAKFLSG